MKCDHGEVCQHDRVVHADCKCSGEFVGDLEREEYERDLHGNVWSADACADQGVKTREQDREIDAGEDAAGGTVGTKGVFHSCIATPQGGADGNQDQDICGV